MRRGRRRCIVGVGVETWGWGRGVVQGGGGESIEEISC